MLYVHWFTSSSEHPMSYGPDQVTRELITALQVSTALLHCTALACLVFWCAALLKRLRGGVASALGLQLHLSCIDQEA